MYVIVPRRHRYWIEQVRHDGTRRVIDCFLDEETAVQRLHELQDGRDAREQRWLERENSRWNVFQPNGYNPP